MLEIVGLGLVESRSVVEIYFALFFIILIRLVLLINIFPLYLYHYQKIIRNIYRFYTVVFLPVLGFSRRPCVLSLSLFFNSLA